MEPDLESSPGPWWTADLAGEGSMVGWYAEFADQRRNEEIAAVTQIYHMKRSLDELQDDFGRQALELKPGNNAWSKSQFNNTAGLAARVGFGLFHGDKATYYLDREVALDLAGLVPDFNTGYDTLETLNPQRWPDHPDISAASAAGSGWTSAGGAGAWGTGPAWGRAGRYLTVQVRVLVRPVIWASL